MSIAWCWSYVQGSGSSAFLSIAHTADQNVCNPLRKTDGQLHVVRTTTRGSSIPCLIKIKFQALEPLQTGAYVTNIAVKTSRHRHIRCSWKRRKLLSLQKWRSRCTESGDAVQYVKFAISRCKNVKDEICIRCDKNVFWLLQCQHSSDLKNGR